MATVPHTPAGQRFLVRGVDWDAYLSMREAIGDGPVRMTYDRGALELMSPSDVHERFKKLVDRILLVLAEELNVPLRSQGSTTFTNPEAERGLEPDECYYIQNESLVRGRDEIDLSIDPPPDLAVEIDVTRSSLNRLDIYASIGVPEVWRYDGKSVQIYVLTPDREYREQAASLSFPAVSATDLEAHLDRRNDLDEVSWTREFRQWVRSTTSRPGERPV